jgi:hypothetical protein
MRASDFGQRRFLLAVFEVSGFTGLIYESIWSHYPSEVPSQSSDMISAYSKHLGDQ